LTQFQTGVIFKIVNFGLRAFAVLIHQSGQARREFTPQERTLSRLQSGEARSSKKTSASRKTFSEGKKVIKIPGCCV